ncbi:uncharacterized protein LOC123558496 [Mercenaria mercenaria]|uniref:uncharacterized protein LOC123558496 n=1 Tax=Mercenaria mercenaria TaxID=6596 RepID=UPI00234EEC24|nr:uncharacterized protein LOC123558496 [Mercenaria mercenaria]
MADQTRKCLSTVRMQVAVVGVIYFLFRVGLSMFDTTIGPYLLRVVCEKRFFENNDCDRLEQLLVIENEVREYAGFYFILFRLFLSVPVICSGLYCGAWSDRKGRKIPMLFPCVGTILSAMAFIMSLYIGPQAVWTALLGTLVRSVFGNTIVFAMSVNSFIASVSDNDQRTKQISIIYAISSFGETFESLLAGLLKWEFLLSYGIVIGIQSLTVIIIIVFLRENENNISNEYIEHTSETETNSLICSKLSRGIKSYATLLTESGTNSVRIMVIVQLCLTLIYGFDINGVEDVLLMYSRYEVTVKSQKASTNIFVKFGMHLKTKHTRIRDKYRKPESHKPVPAHFKPEQVQQTRVTHTLNQSHTHSKPEPHKLTRATNNKAES